MRPSSLLVAAFISCSLLLTLMPLAIAEEVTSTLDYASSLPLKHREGRDSYLDALKASHNGGVDLVKPIAVVPSNHKAAPLTASFQTSSSPQAQFLPVQPDAKYSDKFSAPITKYGPPETKYGPPEIKYGPPDTKYGPPDTKYGAPETKPIKFTNEMPYYGVPHYHHHYQITEPPPEPLMEAEDGGHGGFDLKTVFKFIAKVVVLKVIVKMIYIVMYLLFMPKINLLQMLALGDTDTEKEKPDTVEEESDEKPEDEIQQIVEDDDDDSFLSFFSRGSRGLVPKGTLDRIGKLVQKALDNPPS